MKARHLWRDFHHRWAELFNPKLKIQSAFALLDFFAIWCCLIRYLVPITWNNLVHFPSSFFSSIIKHRDASVSTENSSESSRIFMLYSLIRETYLERFEIHPEVFKSHPGCRVTTFGKHWILLSEWWESRVRMITSRESLIWSLLFRFHYYLMQLQLMYLNTRRFKYLANVFSCCWCRLMRNIKHCLRLFWVFVKFSHESWFKIVCTWS